MSPVFRLVDTPVTWPIRVAAQLHPQHGAWTGIRRAAVDADRLGYDIV